MSLSPVTSPFLTRVTTPCSLMGWVSSLVTVVIYLVLVLQGLNLLPQHLDCVALDFPQLSLLFKSSPGVAELLAQLLGVRLQPHVPQLLLHLAHLGGHPLDDYQESESDARMTKNMKPPGPWFLHCVLSTRLALSGRLSLAELPGLEKDYQLVFLFNHFFLFP